MSSFTRLSASSPEAYKKLLDAHDTWMFDCDGVLWHGTHPIDGVIDLLNALRALKKSIIFVTNNATQSRATYKKKFDKMGIDAHVDEIYGSAYAAAIYLSSVIKLPKEKKVYVIGMAGLEEELRSEGITCIGGTDPEDNQPPSQPLPPSLYAHDPTVGAVLCGLDMSITYTKLSKAFTHLTNNADCLFIATNGDATYPAAPGGVLLPGAGSIWAPLKESLSGTKRGTIKSAGLGAEPVVVGKPEKVMLDCIKAKHGFDPSRTIMVGDRLNTDILFGKQGGLTTLLVMTGIAQESDISGPNASSIVPDYVTDSVADVLLGCGARST